MVEWFLKNNLKSPYFVHLCIKLVTIICTSQHYRENAYRVHLKSTNYYHYYSFSQMIFEIFVFSLVFEGSCPIDPKYSDSWKIHMDPSGKINYMLELHSKYILLEHITGCKLRLFPFPNRTILLKENISSKFFLRAKWEITTRLDQFNIS